MKSVKILTFFSFFLLAEIGCTVSDPEMMELLQEIKAQNDKLLLEVEAMKGTLALLDGKYQVILASLADNKKELEALKVLIDSLKVQIAQQLIKIDQLSAQLTQQGADIVKLSQEIKELKASVEELKDKIDELLEGRSPVPTNGLIAWYPFNGNASDESGNGNNGTVNGATLTVDRFEKTNNAFIFNGLTNYIDLGKNENLTPKNFTIASWIKIGTPLSNLNMILRARFYGYSLMIKPNGQVLGEISDNVNTGHGLNSISNVNDGKWHLVVFSFDKKTLSLYIDGILEASKSTIGESVFYGLTGIAIGRDADANIYYYKGIIDDVAIWNRGLTTEEISKIFKGEKF